MTGLRIGSLFSGYGGLEMGVQAVLGGQLAWYSEIEPAACRVLEHHHPGVPNLGDVTAIDWSSVQPVDMLTGGFPCQDVSSAGRRVGMRPGNRSGLWSHMRFAISQIRPRLVVIENVRGLLSADAHCDLEPCPWCLGDDEGRPLRALGCVLGDLADLGYDAQWIGLRASGPPVYAPHRRFRVFIGAWPTANTERIRRGPWWPAGPAETSGRWPSGHLAGRGDDAAADPPGPGWGLREPQHVSVHGGEAVRAGQEEPGRCGCAASHPEGTGLEGQGSEPQGRGPQRGNSAATEASGDGCERDAELDRRPIEPGQQASLGADPAGRVLDWGVYVPAIRRWERILGRPAPDPTQVGKRGGQRLSPPFVEWLMGLPEGHVTGVPGLTRNEQLKLLGNGVVWQQAAAALPFLLTETGRAVA